MAAADGSGAEAEAEEEEEELAHAEVLELFQEGLVRLVQDPLLCDLPVQVGPERRVPRAARAPGVAAFPSGSEGPGAGRGPPLQGSDESARSEGAAGRPGRDSWARPLFCPGQVTPEEINSQIALEYGQAMTVRVCKADEEVMRKCFWRCPCWGCLAAARPHVGCAGFVGMGEHRAHRDTWC